MWPDITAGQASRGTGQGGGGGQLVRATAKTAGPGQEARTAVLATQQSLLVSVLSQEESGNWLCCIVWTLCGRGVGGAMWNGDGGGLQFLTCIEKQNSSVVQSVNMPYSKGM